MNNEFKEIEDTLGTNVQATNQKASFTSPLRTTVDQRDALLTSMNSILSHKMNMEDDNLYTKKSVID